MNILNTGLTHDNHVISLVFFKRKSKVISDCWVSIFSSVVRTENIFKTKSPFSNFSSVVWSGSNQSRSTEKSTGHVYVHVHVHVHVNN